MEMQVLVQPSRISELGDLNAQNRNLELPQRFLGEAFKRSHSEPRGSEFIRAAMDGDIEEFVSAAIANRFFQDPDPR
jgi:hypothetical protein